MKLIRQQPKDSIKNMVSKSTNHSISSLLCHKRELLKLLVEITLSSNLSEEMMKANNLLGMLFPRPLRMSNGQINPLPLQALEHQPTCKSSPPMQDGSKSIDTKENSL
jgi:hypothetical protein